MAYQIYLCVLAAAFIVSLLSFWKAYAWHLKVVSVFLGITVITEICANLTYKLWQPLCGIKTNIPVYNIFMLVEYLLYGVYFYAIISPKKAKKGILVFLISYPLYWTFTSFYTFDICHWNSRAAILGDFVVIILCAIYFRQLFLAPRLVNLKTCPEFWINSGVFIYSCCEIPITGIFNYLGNNYSKLFNQLDNILDILNIVLYLIIIYAFICPLLTKTRKY